MTLGYMWISGICPKPKRRNYMNIDTNPFSIKLRCVSDITYTNGCERIIRKQMNKLKKMD